MNLLSLVLDTPRLTLRPLHTGDAQAVAATFTASVSQQMTQAAVAKLHDTQQFLTSARQMLVKNEQWHAAIQLKGGKLIGCISLRELNSPLPSVGLWIADNYQRQGLGKEALSAVLAWARANLMLEHTRYVTFSDNLSSIQLAKTMGGFKAGEKTEADGTGSLRKAVEYWL